MWQDTQPYRLADPVFSIHSLRLNDNLQIPVAYRVAHNKLWKSGLLQKHLSSYSLVLNVCFEKAVSQVTSNGNANRMIPIIKIAVIR